MNLNDYLETVKSGGWLEQIMPPDPPDADEEMQEDAVMRTELSLCFPLLLDSHKAVLLGAWWATRALTLGVNLPREHIEEENISTLEQSTNSAELIYMKAREAVDMLKQLVEFTPAQLAFIESDILHVPFKS
jgi:hypothetical protein